MRNITIDNEPHVLLTNGEYNDLVKAVKKPPFTLAGLPVQLHMPLEEKTCSNWYSWISENTGVYYKGERISISQLKFLIDLLERKDNRRFSRFTEVTVLFDNLPVNKEEINRLITVVERCLDRLQGGYMFKPIDTEPDNYHEFLKTGIRQQR